MKIRYLSKKEIKELTNKLRDRWGVEIKLKRVKAVSLEKGELVIGDPTLIIQGDLLIPFLGENHMIEKLPKVVIDMGAVPHIVRGANVMRPGIVEVRGDMTKGCLVSVIDEKFGKAIAVGLWAVELEEFLKMRKGVVVVNLHYVGDEFWEAAKELNLIKP